jgi:glucose-6-phosphate 1-dehydrogenase
VSAIEAAAAPGTTQGQIADPCVMVIFGASGDLTKRKLIPALYNLAKDRLLSRQFAVVGFATRDLDSETFRGQLGEALHHFVNGDIDAEIWEWLARRIHFVRGSL